MAPLRSGRSLSGIIRSGSMRCSTPSPPHAGQAPNGLLNENSRGSISEIVKPDTGQANFSEKMMRSGSALPRAFFSLPPLAPSSPSPERGGSDRRRRSGEGSRRGSFSPPPPPCPPPPPPSARGYGHSTTAPHASAP